MIKVYRCVSEISFNLKIDGNKRRINFEPMTGGRSQFRTNECKVQEGIEKLDQFGNIIHVVEVIEEDGDDTAKDEVKSGSQEDITKENIDKGGENLLDSKEGKGILNEGGADAEKDIQKDITSFAEAKEYLITKGCEKTIRSKDNILNYAKELGVEFPNLK
ncbi:hypothetical protein NXW38_05980 [Bacteroides ovatus]|jgi:hypothetical protein|uniref:hypothetical protein n=1 Tax=Bacteroides ovatus TaxID=28116 RepID=UPI001CCCDDAA|nr:hypothetical protein [Bacteroides ovatus]MCS3099784.1 hypothetical protein [Bacteroides ovatus]UBF06642.1 hypothetical protein K6V23_19665 [Bacteroides ovatus]DAU74102.1 MAG TPA: hypothetical protein [Crassvirales sp.]